MKKLVVFSVGGALCCYLEVDGQTFMIDAGRGDKFNPVTDFLLPYFEKTGKRKGEKGYKMDQLIISHPHKDHISCLPDYIKHFYPDFITCPNDKTDKGNELNTINWELFYGDKATLEEEAVKTYRQMYAHRDLPLQKALNCHQGNSQYLYQLCPKKVEEDRELVKEYANNISLVTYFTINGYHILFPGDIMKDGFKKLMYSKEIDGSHELAKGLSCGGIDILIAPHHGLESAFCTEMFGCLPNGKVRCLNIVSEKANNPNENRDVDGRYSLSDYCSGENNLETSNGIEQNNCRRTSQGHICIDLSKEGRPDIQIIQETDKMLDWFIGENSD